MEGCRPQLLHAFGCWLLQSTVKETREKGQLGAGNPYSEGGAPQVRHLPVIIKAGWQSMIIILESLTGKKRSYLLQRIASGHAMESQLDTRIL